jgi:hypothetical protein
MTTRNPLELVGGAPRTHARAISLCLWRVAARGHATERVTDPVGRRDRSQRRHDPRCVFIGACPMYRRDHRSFVHEVERDERPGAQLAAHHAPDPAVKALSRKPRLGDVNRVARWKQPQPLPAQCRIAWRTHAAIVEDSPALVAFVERRSNDSERVAANARWLGPRRRAVASAPAIRARQVSAARRRCSTRA